MTIVPIALAAALATPAPAVEPSTPPPEPNHITVAGEAGYVATLGCNFCKNWSGFTAQALGQYEFQVSPHLRLSDTLHWDRFSSSYRYAYGRRTYTAGFDYDEYDDQLDVEIGRPQLPTGIGIGYFDAQPVYQTRLLYHLSGLGFGVDHWADWGARASPYVSAWYYPHLTGSSTQAYAIFRGDLGLNVRESLASPWGVRVGVQYEHWNGQSAAMGNYLNFFVPYVSITWWQ
ncbi:MAG: hypothetical protein ACREMP_09345 [Candidatus Tyrphobacter sp.]